MKTKPVSKKEVLDMVAKVENVAEVEEEKMPFCMKCRNEIKKAGARFCPDCRGLVLFYTSKQITTFKNQKAKKKDLEEKKTVSKPSRIATLLGEEEFNPAQPYPKND
jgi:tRNA(Ile2) C34 agmatinyltransferase TiaS